MVVHGYNSSNKKAEAELSRIQASLGYKVSQWYAIMLHSAEFLGTNDLFSGLSVLKEIRSLSIKDYCMLRVKYSNFSKFSFGPAC